MYLGGKEIKLAYLGKKVIIAAHLGLKLIWQLLKSCFGGGYWNNTQPWDNKGGWHNGLKL